MSSSERRWPWRAFLLPGVAQLSDRETARGGLYAALALGTAAVAWSSNRYLYLKLFFRLKELELPQTVQAELYQAKQDSLWFFLGVYAFLGLLSAWDYVRTSPRDRPPLAPL